MKKPFLGALVCAGFSVSAMGQATLYGKANVSYQTVDEVDESFTELKSNASRLGVKGDYTIDDNLTAIYKMEFEVQVDDGDKDGETFSQRNIFVGLKGDFGAVKAGKIDTPLKVAQKKIDLFNDLEGDIKNIFTDNDIRSNNIIIYDTPAIASFGASVALISSEEDGVDDGVSTSVAFEQSGFYVAVAFDQNVQDEDTDVIRVVGQYNVGGLQIGALWESQDAEGVDEVEGTFASLQYKLNKWAFKVQYGSSDIVEDGGTTLSFGGDYKLAKPLKLFAYYTQNESDVLDLGGENISDDDYLGVGIELKF